MTDLVVVSLEAWDDVWRRNQHIVAGLLAAEPELRVLFVEPPADPVHDLSARRRPDRGHGVVRVHGVERLWSYRPVKWLPRRMDRRADDRLAEGIIRAAARLGMHSPQLWINDPGAASVLRLSGWHALYDMTDDWLTAARPGTELERIRTAEDELLRNAHAVVACSVELVRRKSKQRPSMRSPIVLIPNAVDVAAYRRPVPRPADMPAAPVVYVGTLHSDRFDVELATDTARALGDRATLLLVGPNLLGASATETLTAAGVRLTGPRTRQEVIAYLQHADVLVVPHVVTPFTESLDPIKLYEYQAVDRPVVSTPVAGFRDAHDPRIEIAAGEAFVAAVRRRVASPGFAEASTTRDVPDWSERVDAFRGVLRSMTT